MPINGAQPDTHTQLCHIGLGLDLGAGPEPGHQAAQQVHPVHPGQQLEESEGRVRQSEIAQIDEKLPRPELTGEEGEGGHAGGQKASLDAF